MLTLRTILHSVSAKKVAVLPPHRTSVYRSHRKLRHRLHPPNFLKCYIFGVHQPPKSIADLKSPVRIGEVRKMTEQMMPTWKGHNRSLLCYQWTKTLLQCGHWDPVIPPFAAAILSCIENVKLSCRQQLRCQILLYHQLGGEVRNEDNERSVDFRYKLKISYL